MKNKKKALMVILGAILMVVTIGITYAFVTQTLNGNKKVVVSAGVLDLELEEENAITISDALPIADEVGMIQEDAFVFRLVNKTANPTNYNMRLAKIETSNELDESIVRYGLIKEEERIIDSLSNISNGLIDSGTIAGNDTIDYELRLWIDSTVTDDSLLKGKSLSYKLDIEAGQITVQSNDVLDNTLPISWNSTKVAGNTARFIYEGEEYVKISNLTLDSDEIPSTVSASIPGTGVFSFLYTGLQAFDKASVAVYYNSTLGEYFLAIFVREVGYVEEVGVTVNETGLYVLDFDALSGEVSNVNFEFVTYEYSGEELDSGTITFDGNIEGKEVALSSIQEGNDIAFIKVSNAVPNLSNDMKLVVDYFGLFVMKKLLFSNNDFQKISGSNAYYLTFTEEIPLVIVAYEPCVFQGATITSPGLYFSGVLYEGTPVMFPHILVWGEDTVIYANYHLYNGNFYPGLPEYDTTKYKYAYIADFNAHDKQRLLVSSTPMTSKGQFSDETFSYIIFREENYEWVVDESGNDVSSTTFTVTASSLEWSNTTVYDENGAVVLEPSEPVPAF